MPWFAWLFLGLSIPAIIWWAVDEVSYNRNRVRTEEDTLTALARAVGVFQPLERNDKS